MRPLLAFALGVTLMPALAAAGEAQDRQRAAWKAYAEAKLQWHADLAELLIRRQPDLRDAIELDRDLQNAKLYWRTARLHHLLATDPGRLVINKGLLLFANFEWPPQETEAVTAASAYFASVYDRVTRLEARAKEQAGWPELERALWEARKSPDYQARYQQLQQRLAAAEALLADAGQPGEMKSP